MSAYVSDYLPTFLDAVGMQHPKPDWPSDGISLMPLLKTAAAQPADQPVVTMNRYEMFLFCFVLFSVADVLSACVRLGLQATACSSECIFFWFSFCSCSVPGWTSCVGWGLTKTCVLIDFSCIRTKPLGFELGHQRAWIDGDWKLIQNGEKGQCGEMLPPYKSGEGE